MLWGAKGGSVRIDGTDMDYISFGKGQNILILLPGLGDGLTTVRGKAPVLALAYRMYAGNYTVYMFSRKNCLREGYSTREMARDQAQAMKILGISKAAVLGVSQGGMIAQYLAIDYPALVDRLVLAVTLARANETMRSAVGYWMELADRGEYKKLLMDTAEKSYSERYLKKYRLSYPFLGLAGKPENSRRFLIQAAACREHNACLELDRISCPTLVIGGGRDQIAGAESSAELAEKIRNSRLFTYEELGHGAYEEAKDFNSRVLDFLKADL